MRLPEEGEGAKPGNAVDLQIQVIRELGWKHAMEREVHIQARILSAHSHSCLYAAVAINRVNQYMYTCKFELVCYPAVGSSDIVGVLLCCTISGCLQYLIDMLQGKDSNVAKSVARQQSLHQRHAHLASLRTQRSGWRDSSSGYRLSQRAAHLQLLQDGKLSLDVALSSTASTLPLSQIESIQLLHHPNLQLEKFRKFKLCVASQTIGISESPLSGS